MEMSLIHAGLAAGVALAALPVILHLFMRQTPKHVIFPALRLIRERQKQSKKRLRIKNWLLLLARMAVLALMALALARPRLYSQIPLGDDTVPTALGLVFDTSLSMAYKEKDKSRLDEAKERAREIVSKLPDSSLVFVADSGDPGAAIGVSPSAALKHIESLTIRPVNRPLNPVMGQVYPMVADCDRPVHVVYVLTDLARSAWYPDRPADGLEQVAKLKSSKGSKIATFILRLAPKDLHDVAVESADTSSSVATQGESVEIRTRIRSRGSAETKCSVEFELDEQKRGEKSIQIPPNQQVEVSFNTPPHLREGELHQGRIKLTGAPDPFQEDDERFFTFKVRPPLKVLVISDQAYDAEFVAAALDPMPTPNVPRQIMVERVRAAELGQRFHGDLQAYSCVFLLNVKQLDEADWGTLNRYTHEGGGLVVAPGHLSSAAGYNNPITSQFLPAQLGEKPHPARPGTTVAKLANLTHPLFEREGKDMMSMFSHVPVYKYWPVRDTAADARVLLSYSDNAPALLERTLKGPKTGRVLLWTTPLSRRPDRAGAAVVDPGAWSEFPLPQYGWTFFVLMNRTVPFMAGTTSEPLNFEAGENALLKLPPNVRFTSVVATSSDPKLKPQVLPTPSNEFLEIPAPPALGPWTVKATTADNQVKNLGFSVNVPRTESQFEPLHKSDLDTIFGKEGYVLAEDAVSHKEKETYARFGWELFPSLMFLILLVVTLENFLANTFYKEAPQSKAVGAVGAVA
jgi:hypothetical protein